MENLLGLGVFGTFGQPYGFQQAFSFDVEFSKSLDLDNEEIALFPGTELYSVKREFVNGVYSIAFCLYSHAREMNANRNGTFIGSAIVLQQVYVDPNTIYKLLRELHDDIINNAQNLSNNTIQVRQAVNLNVKEPAQFQTVKFNTKTIENTPYYSTKINPQKKFFINPGNVENTPQVVRFFDEALKSYKDAETLYFSFNDKISHYIHKKGAIKVIEWDDFTSYKDGTPRPPEAVSTTPKTAPVPEKPVQPVPPVAAAMPALPLGNAAIPLDHANREELQKMVDEYDRLIDYSKQMRDKLDSLLLKGNQPVAAEMPIPLLATAAPVQQPINPPVPEPIPTPAPQPVHESKPLPAPTPEPVPEIKTASAPIPAPQPAPIPTPAPESVPVPKPIAPMPAPIPAPEPIPEPVPKPIAPVPATIPAPEPIPVQKTEPAPVPKPVPPPQPAPKPVPAPAPLPPVTSKPEPAPAPKPSPAQPKPHPAPIPKPTPPPAPPRPEPKPQPVARPEPVPPPKPAPKPVPPVAQKPPYHTAKKEAPANEMDFEPTPFYKRKGVIIGVVLLLVVGAGAAFLYKRNSSKQTEAWAAGTTDSLNMPLSHDSTAHTVAAAAPGDAKPAEPTPAASQPESAPPTPEEKPAEKPVEKPAREPIDLNTKKTKAVKEAKVAKEAPKPAEEPQAEAPHGKELNPRPNSELSESELTDLNQFGIKNMVLSELAAMILQKYPEVGNIYQHQLKDYSLALMQANKGCFKKTAEGYVCIADALRHVPAYKGQKPAVTFPK